MAFEKKILKHMGNRHYVPITLEQLIDDLLVEDQETPNFRQEFDRMVRRGTIVRLKGNRYCIPKDADLITGVIQFRQSGSALLIPDDRAGMKSDFRIYISAEDTWVALHGDRVVVRLRGDSRSNREKDRRSRRSGRDTQIARRERGDQQQTAGRVIRILERARTTLTGTLKKSRLYYYVIPDNPRIIVDILVPDPSRSGLNPLPRPDDRVLVQLNEWTQRHLNPDGTVLASFGPSLTPGAQYEALFHQFNLMPDFPERVMREVAEIPAKVKSADVRHRLDMTKQFVLTIDPDDAKDFDDALSIEKFEDGRTKVGVHIADVAHYVKYNSNLDREAERRGNSTYLVGRVIPMLPHALSNGICSLVEGEERLVKSVFLHFNKQGNLTTKVEFSNSVINSRKRLTYRQAYAFLKDKSNRDIKLLTLPKSHQTGHTGRALKDLSDEELNQLKEVLKDLWHLAERMRNRRMKQGSLELDMPETKVFVNEEGYADRIEGIENDESHQLVEEYMLAANEAVAREMHRAGYPVIHRVHDKPDAEKLEELEETVVEFGIDSPPLVNRKAVKQFLRKIQDHPQKHFLRTAFLRSLKQAGYRATPDGHYGLNKKFYAHFTSPIRRYADLTVHRVLDRYLFDRHLPTHATEIPQGVFAQSSLERIAQHISGTEQNSSEAERESVKIKTLEFFEMEVDRRVKTKFEAVITDIKNHGMFIELLPSIAYGLIHISTMRDDFYSVSQDGTRLNARRKKKSYTMGQVVTVVTDRVDRYKRQIDFRLAK